MMWCEVLQKERDCGQMDMTGLIIDLVFATFVGWVKIVKYFKTSDQSIATIQYHRNDWICM